MLVALVGTLEPFAVGQELFHLLRAHVRVGFAAK